MDLWIRSQDKRKLIPNPKLGIDEVENKFYIVDRYDFERATILGTYSTKERALEVLDEIQDLLYNYQNVDNLVYEMPKE